MLGAAVHQGVFPRFRADEAPSEMRSAVARYERRFRTRFATLTWFSEAELARLHDMPPDEDLPPSVSAPSQEDAAVRGAMRTIGEVANTESKTPGQRRDFLSALRGLYGALPAWPQDLASEDDVLCVGPEREGRQLGEQLGCLPADRRLTPHAKRIPLDGGLLVGLSEIDVEGYERCLIVDGVVATGATLMAVMDCLLPDVSSFSVFTAQSTPAGLWAVSRYGEMAGVEVNVAVGAIGGRLNEKYYAVDPADANSLVVGDIGDTIAGM